MQHPGPIEMFPATPGRKPGSLVRFKCCACKAQILVSGGSDTTRCNPCKAIGRGNPTRKYERSGKSTAILCVQTAIRTGALAPARGQQCVDCGADAVEYEHRDYGRPLDVVPICRSCNLLRGPAIPDSNTLRAVIQRGGVPYRLRSSAQKLLSRIGQPIEALAVMPTKLTNLHWRELLPLFVSAKA